MQVHETTNATTALNLSSTTNVSASCPEDCFFTAYQEPQLLRRGPVFSRRAFRGQVTGALRSIQSQLLHEQRG
jgi:hypothetical protein